MNKFRFFHGFINVLGWIFLILIASCEDKVREFDGFTQKELEYLLSGDEGKIWLRTQRFEGDNEVDLVNCEADNFIFFAPVSNAVGKPKPLLYGYNPELCDSIDFCAVNPQFCESHSNNCETDPELCAALGEGILYIGTWYAKAPFVVNDRADTLVFEINEIIESIHVMDINSMQMEALYKNRKTGGGETITETYEYLIPRNE